MAEIIGMHCCGCKELADIRDFEKPEELMLAFCGVDTTGYGGDMSALRWTAGQKVGPPAGLQLGYYIFTEVTEESDEDGNYDDDENEEPADPAGIIHRNYGQKLRDFILANGLGTVMTCEPALNPNYAHHLITLFVWHPDADGLWKWFQQAAPTAKNSAMSIYDSIWGPG